MRAYEARAEPRARIRCLPSNPKANVYTRTHLTRTGGRKVWRPQSVLANSDNRPAAARRTTLGGTQTQIIRPQLLLRSLCVLYERFGKTVCHTQRTQRTHTHSQRIWRFSPDLHIGARRVHGQHIYLHSLAITYRPELCCRKARTPASHARTICLICVRHTDTIGTECNHLPMRLFYVRSKGGVYHNPRINIG